jgi:DHA1 family bicyclomycin/chloramphenicol resistance-like MFS transporter
LITSDLLAHRVELIVLLGAISAFASLSVDSYLPALPTLERVFAATSTQVQLTLASFFVAFAFGQAFYGPVSDRFGRRRPLCIALLLFALASGGCALAWSIQALAAMRFVQGLGACAGGVIARAIVRDSFAPRDTARIFSALMLVTGFAPMLAPLIGGYVLVRFGWRAIFWLLALVGTGCVVAIFLRLPETHIPDAALELKMRQVVRGYGRLLGDRRYLGFALAGALSMAGMFAYIAGSPFVFIDMFGVAPNHFGWIFGVNALGFVVASQVNARLVRRLEPLKLLKAANLVQGSAGLSLLLTAALGIGGIIGVILPLLVYISCIGFILPNSTALAMAPFSHNAGAASALLGTIQFTIAALTATTLGLVHYASPLPMAAIIAVCGLASVGLYRRLS